MALDGNIILLNPEERKAWMNSEPALIDAATNS